MQTYKNKKKCFSQTRTMPPAKRTNASATKTTARSTKKFKPAKTTSRTSGSVGAVVIPRPFALPLMLKNTMRYVINDKCIITGGNGFLFYSANGLTNPGGAIGPAHKPLYFNQMIALYDHYHVTYSKISVSFAGSGAVEPSNNSYVMTIFNDDDGAVLPNFGLPERPTAKSTLININSYMQRPVSPITASYSASKVFGSGTMANDALRGDGVANPLEGQYFQLRLAQCDGGGDNTTLYFHVEIEYSVIWNELKDVIAST